ncbi:MAG: hypothetical protein SFT90_03855 [Rickettsiales bacterium]|nr:hypothetical protein [Rickettsiales bacterium]
MLEDETAEISEITLNNKEDIKQAGELIVKNMITGKISPSEANQMLALVERYAEIIRG